MLRNCTHLLILIICVFFFLIVFPYHACAQQRYDTGPPSSTISDNSSRPYASPEAWGPYAVGIQRQEFVDGSRWEEHGTLFRTLPTSIWYPAINNTGYTNTLGQCMGTLPWWIVQILIQNFGTDLLDTVETETHANRSADLDTLCAPYPVVFFSHGLASNRIQNYTMCERLASHGFIVVAPDHYGNAMITNTDQRPVFFDPATIVSGVIDRPVDVAFIYHALTTINDDSKNFFYQAMDLANVGITGHSFGGFTCLSAGPRYDFVKSMAPLTPVMLQPFPDDFNKPFLLLQSDTDDICDISLNSNRRALEAFLACESSKKIYLMLSNAGHFSPSDICTMGAPQVASLRTGCEAGFVPPATANNIAASYLTAFFKVSLSDDSRYNAYLTTNNFPENLAYFWSIGF